MNVKNLKDMFEKKETSIIQPINNKSINFDKSINSNGVKEVSRVFQNNQKQQQKSQKDVRPINKINKNNNFLNELNMKLNNGPAVRKSMVQNQGQNNQIILQRKVQIAQQGQFIPLIAQPNGSQLSNELKNRMKSYREDVTVNQPKNDIIKSTQKKQQINYQKESQIQPRVIDKPKNYFINDLEKMLGKANKNKTPEKNVIKIEPKPVQIPKQMLFNKKNEEEQQEQKLTFSKIGRTAQKKQPQIQLQINFNDIIKDSQKSQMVKSCLKRRFGRQQYRETAEYENQLAVFLKDLDKNQFQSRLYAESKIQISNEQTSTNKGSFRFQAVSGRQFKDNAYYSTLNYEQKLSRINFVINSVFKNTNREIVKGNPKIQNTVFNNAQKIGTKQNQNTFDKNQKNIKNQSAIVAQKSVKEAIIPGSKVEEIGIQKKVLHKQVNKLDNDGMVKEPVTGLNSGQHSIQMVVNANMKGMGPQIIKPLKKHQKRNLQNFDDA